MYLYFNENGVLKEIINDDELRQGSDSVNTIYAYFENSAIINASFKQDDWNNDPYGSVVNKEVPYNESRKLLYFKYFTTYKFFAYTMTSTDLANAGNHSMTIRGFLANASIVANGEITYNIESSNIVSDPTITLSQYDYLKANIGIKADKTYVDSKNDDQDTIITSNTQNLIVSIAHALTDGVLTTTATKTSLATLQAIVDLKTLFYLKSEVYSKKESDEKFLNSDSLVNYLLKSDASSTYETKVDSASKLTEAKAYTDTNVATLNEKNATQDTAINTAQTKADSAYELASGKANTYIFDTYALMKSALASASSTTYHLGDNLLIKETGVSDYWVSAVNATQSGDYGYYEVSEDEINLEPYQKKIDNALATTNKTIVGGINELNSLKAPISTTQTKTDNTLTTTNKTIAGGINENKASIDTLSDEVISNVGKLQQIDLVGTLAGGVITFTTSDTYTLKENCTYELDLHFNVAGSIDNSYSMVLKINDTTINLQNILNNSGTMKVRDMLQLEKYTNAVGYRWIFNAIYNTVSGASFFGIPATISKCDILSLSTSDITAKLQTFDKGQVVQDITTGLFYIISVDFATETRTLVEMPTQFAKTSALTNGNIIVKTASNYADSGTIKTTFDTKANISDLSTVATSGLYSDLLNKPVFNNVAYSGLYSDLSGVPTISTVGLSGSYNDLLNKPTYATVATSGKYSDLLNIPTFATVATSGKYTDLNNIPTFATVATSGSYNDLTNKPTIPTKTSELTNDSNYVHKTDYATNSVGGVVKATPISDISSVVEVKIYNGKLYCPSVPTLDVQVVSALPTTGNSGVIYLVPKSGATQDIYSEFIWVNSAWEELGGFEIDLSGYLTIASAQATYEPLINASNKIATTYITGLASVATSGSYNDLTNKPTYATVASSGSYNDLLNLPALKKVATTGSYTDLINKPSLSTVATSGLYSDLVGTPNMSLYLLVSTAQSTYQPLFTSTNKLSASYVSGLASVATSGSYNDLTNKPTLSTVATSGSYNDLTNKPTIISNFDINGTVATDGTITFNSLVVANLISAITSKAIITFVPTNADLEPIKLAYKVASGVYTLLGSYSVNNTTSVLNYECMITIIDGVADGSMTIISTQPLLVSGTNIKTIGGVSVLGSGNIPMPTSGYKQTFNVNGSEWGNCYKGLNEMLKEDDMGKPADTYVAQTKKIFKSWQLNGVDVAYPKQITGANSYSARFESDSSDIANLSWDAIIALAKNKAFDSTHLGQIKQLDIGGVAYTAQIVGVNHDDLTDGTGKANLTFELKYLLADSYAMNATNTNSGGWEKSKMRTNVLPNILSQMPTNIQNAIKSVNKANCKVHDNATITYTSDKLFLLSEAELFGVKKYAAALEGTQYEYWANNNTNTARIKCQGEGGTIAVYWWLRSPFSSDSQTFCFVDWSGSIGGHAASETNGVSFAFDL